MPTEQNVNRSKIQQNPPVCNRGKRGDGKKDSGPRRIAAIFLWHNPPVGENRARQGDARVDRSKPMAKVLADHIIREARNLISDPEHWTQFELATTAEGESCDPCDPQAAAFCAYGALIRAACDAVRNSNLATLFARSAASVVLGDARDAEELFSINDDDGQEAVLALFDKALETQSA
jgi:hypothetical protein